MSSITDRINKCEYLLSFYNSKYNNLSLIERSKDVSKQKLDIISKMSEITDIMVEYMKLRDRRSELDSKFLEHYILIPDLKSDHIIVIDNLISSITKKIRIKENEISNGEDVKVKLIELGFLWKDRSVLDSYKRDVERGLTIDIYDLDELKRKHLING